MPGAGRRLTPKHAASGEDSLRASRPRPRGCCRVPVAGLVSRTFGRLCCCQLPSGWWALCPPGAHPASGRHPPTTLLGLGLGLRSWAPATAAGAQQTTSGKELLPTSYHFFLK